MNNATLLAPVAMAIVGASPHLLDGAPMLALVLQIGTAVAFTTMVAAHENGRRRVDLWIYRELMLVAARSHDYQEAVRARNAAAVLRHAASIDPDALEADA